MSLHHAPSSSFFVWIRVFDMANTDEAELFNQLATPNSFIDEHSKVLLEKYLKILKEFIASNVQGNYVFVCTLISFNLVFTPSLDSSL